MFILDISNYAFLEGILFLCIAYILYRRDVAIARKDAEAAELLKDSGFPKRIFSRAFYSAAAISVLIVFVILLVVLEERLSALAFISGSISLAVLMLFTDRTLVLSEAVKTAVPAGPIMSVALSGMALAGVGLFFYVFTWEEASVISGFALGASFVFFFISCGREDKGTEKVVRPFRDDLADLYTSYVSILVAAIAIGSNIENHQRVWTGMPVLFAMTGLGISALAVLSARTMKDEKRARTARYALYLSGVAYLAAVGFLDRELTKKMTADAIAYSGLLDRMGPFWAAAVGFLTAILIRTTGQYYAAIEAKDNNRFAAVAFPVCFLAMGLWIADLFAGLYGIAIAGMGMLGALCMDVCLSASGDDGAAETRQLTFASSVFAALASYAAFSVIVRNAAVAGDLYMDFSDGLAVPGLLLGGLVPFFASTLEKRFPSWPLLLGAILLFVPCIIGSLIGPEALGGLILGSILLSAFRGIRSNGDDGKRITLTSAAMKLVAMVSLVFAPVILRIYETLH